MEEKKYLQDLKNLKPLPLDKIKRTEVGGQRSEMGNQRTDVGGQKSEIQRQKTLKQEIPKHLEEIKTMEKLTNSKTLWGFGIAVFIYVVQNVLIALNIAGPDNLIMKAVIEAIIAIAGFFGVYGIRDALRKMSL